MKLGFIDYYLDEWHANNYPQRIRELSGGKIEVAYAYAEIDAPNGMTTDEWCEKNGIKRCMSIQEITELSDGIIILSPDNCERHEELCKIPLASGKLCYIDKTFAPDKATAQRIFANAEAHNTPCYSTSALRYATEYADIDRSSIRAISSWGPAWGGGIGYETYSIHQLEPIMMLMGSAPKRVMMDICDDKWYTMSIHFEDGRKATMAGMAEGSPFMMNLAMDSGNRVVEVNSDFFGEFLKDLVKFFETGKPGVPHFETINIMAVREAGLRAIQNPGEWIEV